MISSRRIGARVLVLLGAAGAAIAALALPPNHDAASGDAAPDLGQALDSLSDTSERRGVAGPTAPPNAADAHAQPAAERSAPPASQLSPHEQALQTIRALDVAFDSETRDDEWAADRERAIQSISSEKRVKGLTDLRVQCRTTMCRLDVKTGVGLEPRVMQVLMLNPELSTNGYFGPDPSGKAHARLYVSRRGEVLVKHSAYQRALADNRG